MQKLLLKAPGQFCIMPKCLILP